MAPALAMLSVEGGLYDHGLLNTNHGGDTPLYLQGQVKYAG